MGEFLFVCLFVVVLRGVFVMVVFFACLLLCFVCFVCCCLFVCFCNGRGGWEEVGGVVVCRGNSSSFQNALS